MEIPRLHPDTIEEVKQRVDIIDVISEKVVLRKRGKDYLGLCPFHDEKTPSFSVSPTKQLYYCFGCGAGGNAITFLKEINQSSFSEVVLDLTRRYQIPLKTLEPKQHQELQRQISLREQLYEILAVATSFYQHALHQPQGEIALDYLKTERNLDEATINKWELGYAPGGWETLYSYLVEVKRYSVSLVEQVGLIRQRKSGNGYYDGFRDRLTIPIRDTQGRIIGFGSRTLADEQPKYLNSPETPLFDKSKTLFGLNWAKNAIAKQDRAVVVEGYFDVIALHTAGITNAVASLGTAFTQAQLKQLLRYSESKQVVLNFDADAAGNKATQRAIAEIEPLVYAGQVQLRILNLPDGKDADEFIHSDVSAPQTYLQLLLNAPLWLDWLLNQLLQDKDLFQSDQFQIVAKEMVKLLNRLEDPNQRTHYLTYCAQLLAQGDTRLVPLQVDNLLAQIRQRKSKIHPAKPLLTNKSHLDQGQTSSASLPQPELIETLPENDSSSSSPAIQSASVNNKSKLLQQAETLLLRIYIHCPEYRQAIFQLLEAKNLLFSFDQHRWLWEQIIRLQGEEARDANYSSNLPYFLLLATNKLISRLQDLGVEFPEKIAQVNHLFQLDEKQIQDVNRTQLVIRATVASMELVTLYKQKRDCLAQWEKLDPIQEVERSQYYSQQFYQIQKRINELEKMRYFSFLEVTLNAK